MSNKKVLVLLSGGVDSSTCLALAVNFYGRNNVHTLNIFYGQKHDRELQAAQDIADYYQVPYRLISAMYLQLLTALF